MNENKGVFGLNMLKWWDDEGLDRVLEPLAAGLASGELRAGGRRGASRSTAPPTRTASSPSAATSARSCSTP